MGRRILAVAIVGLFVVPGLSRSASGAPEPSITPHTWQLDFQFEDPQRIVIQSARPGEAAGVLVHAVHGR